MNKLEQLNTKKNRKNLISKFKNLSEESIESALNFFNSLTYSSKSLIINTILSELITDYSPIAKGNANLRISGIYDSGDKVYLFENYFGTDTLNSYRRLLDEIAIYSVENEKDYKKIVPIIVFDTIPNKRVDMWATMNDIYNVLGINFKVMTVMQLWIAKKNNMGFERLVKLSSYLDIKKGVTESKFIDFIRDDDKSIINLKKLPILSPKK